ADQLRQKQLVEVRIALSIDLAKRLLEDGNCLPAPVREPERAAELERNRAAPRWVGELFEPGPKVVGGGGAVRPSLGKPEPDEPLPPHRRVHLLLERAGEIFDRGVGCPLDERALRRLAERRDHERVGPRSQTDEVARRTLRRTARPKEQFSGRTARGVSLYYVERLVDGAADHRARELERIVATEEVQPA